MEWRTRYVVKSYLSSSMWLIPLAAYVVSLASIELLTWIDAQLDPAPPEPRIVRRGRTLVTRPELARLTGLSEATVAGLYARRATTGHGASIA